MMDMDQAAKAMRDEEMLDFIEGLQSTDLSRHEDQWSAGAHLVKPAWMERSLTLDDLLAILDLVDGFAQLHLGMPQVDGQHRSLDGHADDHMVVAVSLLNTHLLDPVPLVREQLQDAAIAD
jgi:hypothetical protein